MQSLELTLLLTSYNITGRPFASKNHSFLIVKRGKHLPRWLMWRMKWDDERRMLGPVPETLQAVSQWSLSFHCGQR